MLMTEVLLSRRTKVPIPAGDRRQKVMRTWMCSAAKRGYSSGYCKGQEVQKYTIPLLCSERPKKGFPLDVLRARRYRSRPYLFMSGAAKRGYSSGWFEGRKVQN